MRLRTLLLFSLLFHFFNSNSQKIYEGRINVSTKGTDNRDAVIYLPAHYNASKSYPLVIFTHGMGEAGKNVKKLYKQGLPKVLKGGYRPPFDFIMVAVQRNSFSVAPEWLAGILKDSEKRWKIDASRIYLTGLSAGGWSIYGSQLNFSPDFAKKFAAIVINSGVTQNTNRKNFDWWKQTKTPLWAIVGAADKSYVAKNAYMVKQINQRVPELAVLTIRPGIGHGGWTDVYKGKVKLNGKNMWEWMYQFKRIANSSPKPETDTADDENTGEEENGSGPATPTTPVTTNKYIKVNVYSGVNPFLSTAWNNWNVSASDGKNLSAGKLRYADGTVSGISVNLSSTQRVMDNGEDYGGGMAPARVLRYASASAKSRTLTISGLSPSKKYNIFLFGSRRQTGNRTRYKINKTERTIVTDNNHNNKAGFADVVPNKKGAIVVTIESYSKYNYINGFSITEKAATTD